MSTSTSHSSPTSLKLDPEIKGRIQRLAEARRRTPHWLMGEAIRQYVDREEKQEQLKQVALQAWKKFEDTGLHATAEEGDAWLKQLEEGQDTEPPECHV